MDENVYSVILTDGTTIGNLRKNGDNFISKSAIDATIFEGNCALVTIRSIREGEEGSPVKEETYENMELVQVTKMGEEYWFVLRQLSPEEITFSKMKSDIDFLAMMSDVEL